MLRVMIEILKYQKGEVVKGSLEDLKTKEFVWADIVNPTEEEFNILSEETNVAVKSLKDALHPYERPKLVELERHSFMTFRAPLFVMDALTTTPFSIIVNNYNVITVRKRELEFISRIKSLPAKHKSLLFRKGAGTFVYVLFEEVINTYYSMTNHIESRINHIENEVFENPHRKIAKEIFTLKKSLVFFHKALIANKEVIGAIEKGYVEYVKGIKLSKFHDIYEGIVQLIDIADTYMDILTGSLEIYLTSVSNNLNAIVKKLTAYGSLILVPTLIASIYGMNFHDNSPFNMPELYWKYGYFFALGVMALSAIMLFLYSKKKELI